MNFFLYTKKMFICLYDLKTFWKERRNHQKFICKLGSQLSLSLCWYERTYKINFISSLSKTYIFLFIYLFNFIYLFKKRAHSCVLTHTHTQIVENGSCKCRICSCVCTVLYIPEQYTYTKYRLCIIVPRLIFIYFLMWIYLYI